MCETVTPQRRQAWWLFVSAFAATTIVAAPLLYLAAFAGRADWYEGGYHLSVVTLALLLAAGGTVGLSWLAAPIKRENRLVAAVVTTACVTTVGIFLGMAINS